MSKITVICHVVDGRLAERTSKFVTEDLLSRKKANSFRVFILREFIRKKMKKTNEISNSAFPRETKQV